MYTCTQCGRDIDFTRHGCLSLERRDFDRVLRFHEECHALWFANHPMEEDYFDYDVEEPDQEQELGE